MSESTLETMEMPAENPVLPSVGEQLRTAREGKGLALKEVAQTLKLGVRQLEALENGDWQSLPGATFIRGFVRNYARLLGLEIGPLMAQLDDRLEIKQPELSLPKNMHAAMPEPSGRIQRRDYAFASFGLVVAAIALLIYFFLPDDLSRLKSSVQSVIAMFSRPAPVAVPPASTPEQVLPPGASVTQVINPQSVQAAEPPAAPVAAQSATQAPAEPMAPSGGLQMSFSKQSWVEVRDKRGNVVFSQHGTPGVEKAIDGQPPFSIVIGYAPGVALKYRGQIVDLAPHTSGDVARLTLE